MRGCAVPVCDSVALCAGVCQGEGVTWCEMDLKESPEVI